MSANLTIRHLDNVAVVDISGRITIGDSSQAMHDAVRGLITEGKKKIVLNMKGVTFMDSAGIGEMVRICVTGSHNQSKVKLCELTKRISDLLQITRLYHVLDIYQWEEDALESFE